MILKALSDIKKEDKLNQAQVDYLDFHRDRFDKLIKIITREDRKNSILEVGCGIGVILRVCSRLGYTSLSGCDRFEKSKILIDKYSVKYEKCDLAANRLPYPDNSFDLIVFSEVVEHFNFYPLRILTEFRRILKKRGKIIITTPNQARLNNRIKLLFGKSICWDITKDSDKGAHYREYTEKELSYLLRKADFDQDRISVKCIHFEYPNVKKVVNFINRTIGFFFPSLRSNLLIISKK